VSGRKVFRNVFNLIVLGWVFKFQHMVYEKYIIGKEKYKIMKQTAFCGK
jgi:hypothetical protein